MNFDLPAEVRELQQRTRRFIAEQVIPLEATRAPPASTARARTCGASWWRAPVPPACSRHMHRVSWAASA